MTDPLLAVADYYTGKLRAHGAEVDFGEVEFIGNARHGRASRSGNERGGRSRPVGLPLPKGQVVEDDEPLRSLPTTNIRISARRRFTTAATIPRPS